MVVSGCTVEERSNASEKVSISGRKEGKRRRLTTFDFPVFAADLNASRGYFEEDLSARRSGINQRRKRVRGQL